METFARHLDPGRSLAAAIGWVVLALSMSVALVATLWLGDIVRSNQLAQRGRQLDRTAQRISAELNLDLTLRLQSLRALAAILGTEFGDEDAAELAKGLDNLRRKYPEYQWIDVANPRGRILASTRDLPAGARVDDRAWFALGVESPQGRIVRPTAVERAASEPDADATAGADEPLAELAVAAVDARGKPLGVVGAQLSRRWLLAVAHGLVQENATPDARALLLDTDDAIVIGPSGSEGTRWRGIGADEEAVAPPSAAERTAGVSGWRSHAETLADGERVLVAYATPASADALHALGWRVAVYEPLQDAERRGRILQARIAVVLLALGALTAICGALLARRLTRGLEAIARSADAVRAGRAETIAVPPGRDETARLGRALDELLGSLRRERAALQTLNAELDQRVAARTREIERLAEQERYAAVVRERLKMARDVHDTLAHSMMAMLAEVRLLKRIANTRPEALAEELARAEEAAREGVKEVREAIAQMRFNPVRDAGLAAALSDLVKAFGERTGIAVEFESDTPAGAFADDRAEVLFRIAEEAMHNIERHSGASHVNVSLRGTPDGGLEMSIADDGIGFDPEAAYPGHYGLAGLRELAQLIEAALAIRSAPGQGTTISVAWRSSVHALR